MFFSKKVSRILYFFVLIILSVCFISAEDLNSCNDALVSGTYTLTQDIIADLDTCFSFTQDNIVLDCQGYTVDGNLSMLTGFEAVSVNNITIRNCTIANFLGYGILIQDSSYNVIEDSSFLNIYDDVARTGVGIYLSNVSTSTFNNILVSETYLDGVYLIESNYNNFTNSEVSDVLGEGYGIWIEDSGNNVFDDMNITNNIFGGMSFFDGFAAIGSNDNIVKNSYITDNGDDIEGGVNIWYCEGNLFYNNYFNNTLNTVFYTDYENFWNTSLTSGTNIIGGSSIGGNFWANSTGDDFSETCTNYTDGICNDYYDIDGINFDYFPLVFCGNGICDNGEIYSSCSDDCAYVSVTRDLSDFLAVGQEFEVIFEIIIEDEVTTMSIKDSFPGGEVVNCSEENYTVIGNTLEIILAEIEGSIASRNVTCNLNLNSTEGIFNGSWETTVPDFTGFIVEDSVNSCGDGYCNSDESCSTCAGDCGVCAPVCGNAICESGEDCSNCAGDCGACSSGGGGGGGGGGPAIYTMTEKQLQEGITKQLLKGAKFKVKILNEIHYVNLDEVPIDYAKITVSSNPQTFNLNVGDEKKVDVNNDNIYDLLIILQSIENKKAEITLKLISEEMQTSEAPEEEVPADLIEETDSAKTITGKATIFGEEGLDFKIIIFIIIVIGIIILAIVKRKKIFS